MAISHPSPLSRNLSELSLRASTIAIVVPLVVVTLWYATGHSLDAGARGLGGQPALTLAVGSFVLVPMFALTGAATAAIVAAGTVGGRTRPTRRIVLESAFLAAVGAWAMVAAIAYDAIVIPAIT